ncbi:hypothetical protein Tco_0710941 [Tanacetum coccineum]
MTYLCHWFSEHVGLAGDKWRSDSLGKDLDSGLLVYKIPLSSSADREGLIKSTHENHDDTDFGRIWKFLDDLWNKAFSGTNGEDAVEHIENFLKIIDLLDLPNVSYERLRLAVFPILLTGDAREWLMNEPQSSITTWVDSTNVVFENWLASKFTNNMMMDPLTKNALWDYWKKGDDQKVLTKEALSDLEENMEHEVAEIFRIKIDIFDFETPLCTTFSEFNYLLKIDTDLFTHDIQGDKAYEE